MLVGYIKLIAATGLTAIVAYAGHTFMVNGLKNTITEQSNQLAQLTTENVALKSAATTNEETIDSLRNQITNQINQITALTVSNQNLNAEKDEYLSIFRRHDLQRLSLARPGLIEPRINSGTQDVFRQIEEDSKRLTTESINVPE